LALIEAGVVQKLAELASVEPEPVEQQTVEFAVEMVVELVAADQFDPQNFELEFVEQEIVVELTEVAVEAVGGLLVVRLAIQMEALQLMASE